MPIFLFHGYGSSADTSYTVNAIEKVLYEVSHVDYGSIVRIDYPSTDFTAIHDIIEQQLDDSGVYTRPSELIFIGTSFGAFWARYFANEYKGDSLIMLNPQLDPVLSMVEKVNNGELDSTLTEIRSLEDYYIITDDPTLPITVVLGDFDAVVDPEIARATFQKRGNVVSVPDGHRLKITDEVAEVINSAVNSVIG